VLLRYYEGRSLPEIAEQLNRSRAGIASLLRRGLGHLREQMDNGEDP
jgi:DNA-directed RNA polymerase specialized sigma24 family protein